MVRSEYARLLEQLAAKKAEQAALKAQMGPTHEDGGGWHDNAAFDQLKREERDLANYIADLERFLLECTVVDPKVSYDVAEVGCVVTIRGYLDASGNPTSLTNTERFLIAGDARAPTWTGESDEDSAEPDPFPVSTASPIGKALLGSSPGQLLSYTSGRGNTRLRVLQLS